MVSNSEVFDLMTSADPEIDYTGASAQKYIDKYTDRPEDAGTIEGVQNVLAGLGMVADPFDWLNATIYAFQEDWGNAALYATGVGVLGAATLGSKLGKKYAKTRRLKKGGRGKEFERARPAQRSPSNQGIVKGLNLKPLSTGVAVNARSILEKELLSEKSYLRWKEMMLLGTNKYSGKQRQMIKEFYDSYSKKGYTKVIKNAIRNTPIIEVPNNLIGKTYNYFSPNSRGLGGRVKDWMKHRKVGGWYAFPGEFEELGTVFIPSRTLKSKEGIATIIHELKHSAQMPYATPMNNAYKEILDEYNKKWAGKKIFSARKYNRYTRKPVEVSARLDEIRTGAEHGQSLQAYNQMFGWDMAFDPKILPTLSKKIWGGAPIGLTLKKFNDIFEKEDGK